MLNCKPNFKFLRLIFLVGDPHPVRVCASKVGQSVTRVKIWAGSTLQGPKCLPNNVGLGGSIWATITFLFMDQSSHIYSLNMEGVAVDKILFRFAICRSVPDNSRSKSKVVKSSRILDVFFALPNFRGPAFQKLYPFYYPYLTVRRLEKVLWGYCH